MVYGEVFSSFLVENWLMQNVKFDYPVVSKLTGWCVYVYAGTTVISPHVVQYIYKSRHIVVVNLVSQWDNYRAKDSQDAWLQMIR